MSKQTENSVSFDLQRFLNEMSALDLENFLTEMEEKNTNMTKTIDISAEELKILLDEEENTNNEDTDAGHFRHFINNMSALELEKFLTEMENSSSEVVNDTELSENIKGKFDLLKKETGLADNKSEYLVREIYLNKEASKNSHLGLNIFSNAPLKSKIISKKHLNKVTSKQNKSARNKAFLSVTPIVFIGFLCFIIYLNLSSAKVSVKVIADNDDKSLIKNVKVTIDHDRVIENTNEKILISGLKSGDHSLLFEKPGYSSFEDNVKINGENINLTVRLSKNKVYSGNASSVLTLPSSLVISSDLSTVNMVSDKLTKNISKSNGIKDVLYYGEKNKAYISNNFSDYISVVDLQNNSEIKKIFLGTRPEKIIFSNDKTEIYAQLENSNIVKAISTNSDELGKDIIFNGTDPLKSIIINPANNKLMMVSKNNITDGNIDNFKINNFTGKKINIFKHFVLMMNHDTKEIIKLDLYSAKESRISLSSSPVDMSLSSTLGVLYVASSNEILVINPETEAVIKKIPTTVTNISGIAFSPRDNHIYIHQNNEKNILVYDALKSELLKGTVKLDFSPKQIEFL